MRAEDVGKVEQIIKDTFQQVSETGFEEERIEATIHQYELAIKHVAFKLSWQITADIAML